jgi:hypothetical protein
MDTEFIKIQPKEIKHDEMRNFQNITEAKEADYRQVLNELSETIKSMPLDALRAENEMRLNIYLGDPDFKPPWKIDIRPLVEFAPGDDTRNSDLENKKHPITDVPYERKTVKDADGNEIEGVFPVFESVFDAQLPEELYQATDREQFAECNKQLKEAIENDPELAKKFTPEQLEQIKNGETPDGYTWHHNEEAGKMQLVDSETHAKTGHTGGRVIWGGGSDSR